MATEQPTMSINGTYAQGQGFSASDQAYASHNAAYNNAPQTSNSQSATSNSAQTVPKDEVGWYFVEQYYTTLSRNPDQLHLYYNKRSQFVSGVEEEKVEVCVGSKAINDRIRELDFHECRVRVTNVDSQGADSHIVIQVMGEISNKGQPHRKFVQTFVLAAQSNGYFVLNDIFRYIKEEDEEVPEEDVHQPEPAAASTGYHEPAPTAQELPEPEAQHETVSHEEEAAQVDNKLEEVIQKEEAVERPVSPPPAQVNGTPVPESAEVAQAEEAPAAAVGGADATTTEATTTVEESAEPEKPKESEPTPAPEPAKTAAPAAAPTPAAPPKPMSWAMKAAAAASANRNVTPAVPAVPAQTSAAPKSAPTQPKAAPAPAAPAAVTSAARSESPADSAQDGWQAVGGDHSKRQSRAQNQPAEPTSVRAYIKNVYESTDAEQLKSALSKFDKITYFDVSRAKNAAFVEFATQEGFQAAVAANPHQIGGATVFVEERRQNANQFGGPRFQGGRGGNMGPRGRGDNRAGQGRGGFKEGGRGGFAPRGRGGNAAPRRGGATAA
ncbi:hypothetical protein HDK77DRAFT_384884 [Phyllosticta capitalensis]|uniref:Uncharacterized protein n=2 Tax=Phyllosticta capitalensis TaxID=121624 RepID=A0ABR1YPU1_9PEZI